jgi:hypothetical protein
MIKKILNISQLKFEYSKLFTNFRIKFVSILSKDSRDIEFAKFR